MSAPTLDVVMGRPRAMAGSLVLWFIVATLGILLYLASVSQVDQVARATGTAIASRRVQVIQAVDGGVIEQIDVVEGDRVRAGQVLARFDPVRPRSENDAADAKYAALAAANARLNAELSGGAIQWPEPTRRYAEFMQVQQQLLNGRRQTLNADLANLRGLVQASAEEMAITERLVKAGDSSQLELLRARRQVTEAQSKLDSRRNQYQQDVQTEQAKVRDELEQAEQQATQRRRLLQNIVVTAPMDGIVKNVRFTTLGAVLRPGDELLTIVPVDNRMIVEAKVAPRDIALIRNGLHASLRFDAYDYTSYGAVEGEVVYVSADSMREESQRADAASQTYYRVHVQVISPATTRTGQHIDVIPGMTAMVDVRTGQRSVLEFLFKPINKVMSEAFGER